MRPSHAASLCAALCFSTAALAQPGPTSLAEHTLNDGRRAEALSFGWPRYQLVVEGLEVPGDAPGAAHAMTSGDVDGDGSEDIVVYVERGPRNDGYADVWDITGEGPLLMMTSGDRAVVAAPTTNAHADAVARLQTQYRLAHAATRQRAIAQSLRALTTPLADGEALTADAARLVAHWIDALDWAGFQDLIAAERRAVADAENYRRALLQEHHLLRERDALVRGGIERLANDPDLLRRAEAALAPRR